MSEYVIQARQLSRNFGDIKAIQQLDLQVEKSQIYGFLGPNGCGKTTAIRMLIGLLKPSSGEIEVLGLKLPDNADKLRLKIGYMTQNFSLYYDLTVKENLQFIGRVYGLSINEQKKRIDELLDVYDLNKQKNQLAGTMSGGQRQRLALSAAILHHPELLFLDEPTSAVDPENRRDFWEKMFALSDQGTSILVSTHYMDEAERCHKLAILKSGIKRADDTPENLMQQMDANVVEIEANNLPQLKKDLLELSDIISTAQLGARLRVLVKKSVKDPLDFLSQHNNIQSRDQLTLARPNLEDVFVTSTGEQST